jgi:hypothetical protein
MRKDIATSIKRSHKRPSGQELPQTAGSEDENSPESSNSLTRLEIEFSPIG